MVLAVPAHTERHNVVDRAAVKSQNHVRVHLLNGVLVVTHNIVEASLGVDLALHGDAVMHFLEALVKHADRLILALAGPR